MAAEEKVDTKFMFEIDHGNNESIASQFDVEEFSDACLLVGDENEQRLYVHRFLLAASNPYFKRLFFGNFNDSKQKEFKLMMPNSEDDTQKTGVPYRQLKTLVKTLYTNKFDGTGLDLRDMIICLKLADMYEFTKVLDGLETCIAASINQSNFVELFPCFRNEADTFLHDRLLRIFSSRVDLCLNMRAEDVKALPEHFLKAVLRNENLLISEIEVYKFAKLWLQEHDGENMPMRNFIEEFIRLDKISWRNLKIMKEDEIISVSKLFDATAMWLDRFESKDQRLKGSDCLKLSVNVVNGHLTEDYSRVRQTIGNYEWSFGISLSDGGISTELKCDGYLFSRLTVCTATATMTVLSFRIYAVADDDENFAFRFTGSRELSVQREFSNVDGNSWLVNNFVLNASNENYKYSFNLDIVAH